ncbi:MAG: hypothetical protein WAL04_18660 [Acidimicrobiales bacterium]
MTSTTVSVSVAVDPTTAFRAFTEELDSWWVRGPINYFDSARAIRMQCEPGLGGRLVEVYDDATGAGLELGRIKVWEPGARLAWKSAVDDVEIAISFEATEAGTDVTVEATVPAGRADRGGSAWVRVVPQWFPSWCARRDSAGRTQPELARLALGVYYAEPTAAARWLAAAFGLESPDPLPDASEPLAEEDDGHGWIEFRVGNCSLMVFRRDGRAGGNASPSHEPWVFVDDLEAHFARAAAEGATIVSGIRHTGYRAYVAEDLEGHRWTFAQARPRQT